MKCFFFLTLFLLTPGVFCASAVAADFIYGPGEEPILEEPFNSASAWQLRDMTVGSGELYGAPEKFWMAALHPFLWNLDLDDGEVGLYWSFRTDKTKGEERAKVYVRLNLTDEPGLIEQLNITQNVRPQGFYLVLVDPGFNIPHPVETAMHVHPNAFPDTNTYESFRLIIRKTGTNVVEAESYFWNRSANSWQSLTAYPELLAGSRLPMIVDLQKHLDGKDSFKSVEVQFYENIPFVTAVAVTQVLRAPRVRTVLREGSALTITWIGGLPPYIVERSNVLGSEWSPVQTNQTRSATLPGSAPSSFFRIRSN